MRCCMTQRKTHRSRNTLQTGKKMITAAIISMLALTTLLCAHINPGLRLPVCAGSWYPDNPEELRAVLKSYTAGEPITNSFPYALIAPHAGYQFSGNIAGAAYRQVKGASYKRVIVLSASHTVHCTDPTVIPDGIYRTPLGDVPIADKEIKKLSALYPRLKHDPSVDSRDHTIELHIPFLQTVLRDFSLIPIQMGPLSWTECRAFGRALAAFTKEYPALIIVSSDLSHYPNAHDAETVDQETLNWITIGAASHLLDREKHAALLQYPNVQTTACGMVPIAVLLYYSLAVDTHDIRIIASGHSGNSGGDMKKVVGYGALAFYGDVHTIRIPDTKEKNMSENTVTDEQGKELLTLARETITAFLNNTPTPTAKTNEKLFNEPRGVFVTLRKNHDLRGCIGYIEPIKPLREAVIDNAISAAVRDTRFSPVTPDELKSISIEISVLTPPKKVASYKDIVIGKHGIILHCKNRSATFLPQVAPEQGWDLPTTLSFLASKAGLPAHIWRSDECSFEVYEAQVFNE